MCATTFGSSFLFIDIIGGEVPPVTLACARSIISLLTLAVVLWFSGQRLPSMGRIWGALFVLGMVTQVIPMILLSWGQTHIDSGLAGIILGTVPVLTMLFAHLLFHDERMSARSMVGALIGFSGVIAVIGRGVLGDVEAHLIADLAVLAAAVSIASANVLARKSGHLAPIVLAVGAQSTAVVVLVPMSAVIDQPWNLHVSWETVAALVFLGTVGQCAAEADFLQDPGTRGRNTRVTGRLSGSGRRGRSGCGLPGRTPAMGSARGHGAHRAGRLAGQPAQAQGYDNALARALKRSLQSARPRTSSMP